MYTGSLAHGDLSGAVFTRAHFQIKAQISGICNFHYISEEVLHSCIFITNVLSAADLVHAVFAKPRKPRCKYFEYWSP